MHIMSKVVINGCRCLVGKESALGVVGAALALGVLKHCQHDLEIMAAR